MVLNARFPAPKVTNRAEGALGLQEARTMGPALSTGVLYAVAREVSYDNDIRKNSDSIIGKKYDCRKWSDNMRRLLCIDQKKIKD